MTVLVTGGAGFLGRALVAKLAELGSEVVSFDRAHAAAPTSSTVFNIVGDITDQASLEQVLKEYRITEIVHAAAIVGVTASVSGLADVVRVNIGGSVALFEAATRVGAIRRVLDLSSEEVYGHFSADPIAENDWGRPVSPYGITKCAVEGLGGFYADHHHLRYVAARLCWVYGPGFPRHRLPQPWLEDALAGRSSRLERGGDQRIDFTYVDDAVDGIVLVLRSPHLEHRAYNLATGHATSMRELAGEISALCPAWTVELGDGPLEQAPGVNAAIKGALDISRASALGYTPRHQLSDGLSLTLAALAGGNDRSGSRL